MEMVLAPVTDHVNVVDSPDATLIELAWKELITGKLVDVLTVTVVDAVTDP